METLYFQELFSGFYAAGPGDADSFVAGNYYIQFRFYRQSPIYTFIGFIVFATGFGMETLADYQLQQFRNNPLNKGHIIRSGLWKWSRHPNYLGEAMLWFGLWIISIPCSYWFVTILSPITITLLLRYVSGVPMMEEKFRNHPEWDEYSAKTPVFLPWFR